MTSGRPAGTSAGLFLYSAGVFFFAVNDALAKWLIADYGAGQLMFLRTVGAVAVLIAINGRGRLDLRLRGSYGLHVLRILCSAGDTFCFYSATQNLPLADVMTFYMAAPLIMVALSALLLRERVGILRWTAVICGFVGVVIALRPGEAAFSASSLVALTGSALFATSIIITRRLRATHWLTLTAYQFVGTGLVGGAASLVAWTTPNLTDLGLMFVIGIASMACFMAITKALSIAPLSLLAPLQYASIIWGVLMGWAVWHDIPQPSTIIGVGVIIVSGLVVLRSAPADKPAATPA